MYSAYFFPYRPAASPGGQPIHWPASWADSLARQQEIYEELLASQELDRERPAPVGKSRPLSVREITRDLAGWSLPRAGVPG